MGTIQLYRTSDLHRHPTPSRGSRRARRIACNALTPEQLRPAPVHPHGSRRQVAGEGRAGRSSAFMHRPLSSFALSSEGGAEAGLADCQIDMVFVGAKPPTKTILDEARGGIDMDRRDSEGVWGRRDGVERAQTGGPRVKSIETTIRHDHVWQMPHVYVFSGTGIGRGGTLRGRRRKLRDHGASAKSALDEFKVGALAMRTPYDERMDLEFAFR